MNTRRAEIVSERVSARLSMERARVGATATATIPPESVENAKIAAGGMIFALLAMSAVGLYFVTK